MLKVQNKWLYGRQTCNKGSACIWGSASIADAGMSFLWDVSSDTPKMALSQRNKKHTAQAMVDVNARPTSHLHGRSKLSVEGAVCETMLEDRLNGNVQ